MSDNPYVLPMWIMLATAVNVTFLCVFLSPHPTPWCSGAYIPWVIAMIAGAGWERRHR